MMPGEIQPLQNNIKIVNEIGMPTDYFLRWSQQRQIDISDGISAAQAQELIDDWAAARTINTVFPLTGGGSLSSNLNLQYKGILAQYFANASLSLGPAASDLYITGMQLSFSVDNPTNILISFDGLCNRSAGNCRFAIYEGGSRLYPSSAPVAGVPPTYYSYKNNSNVAGGEELIQEYHGRFILNFAAGTHTIQLWYVDSNGAASTTFYDRIFKAEFVS
jgi:hypothetical protein